MDVFAVSLGKGLKMNKPKAGFDVAVDLRHYGDEIETLLRMLIINGKGIEINCSGLRNTLLNEPIPSISIIVLYRELGVNI